MLEDLLEANRHYVTSFGLAGIPARAAKGVGIVSCMDTRIEPLAMLGLAPGDAKILRNAGGRVTPDVLRSLTLAVAFLGVTEVAVIQHTGCALAHCTDDQLWDQMVPPVEAGGRPFALLAMPDPEAALLADVEAVRTCPLLPTDLRVEGWRYDVETGAIDRVISS